MANIDLPRIKSRLAFAFGNDVTGLLDEYVGSINRPTYTYFPAAIAFV